MATSNQMRTEIMRLADCTFRQAVELWNLGFSEYYFDMSITMNAYVARLAQASICPDLSIAAFVDGEPAGFVLVARKSVDGVDLAWNGGTGVSPSHRGKGVAKLLMREAVKVMEASGAMIGLLEVVQKNAGAIAAYESSGFRVCDELIGAKRTGPLSEDGQWSRNLKLYRIEHVKPLQLSKLPFFRQETAWMSAWHNRNDADGIVVLDQNDEVGAYALVQKSYDDNGNVTKRTLYQCAADRSRIDAISLLHAALSAALGPPEDDCVRVLDNVSMSDPALLEWLEASEFHTIYTQYLMKASFVADAR